MNRASCSPPRLPIAMTAWCRPAHQESILIRCSVSPRLYPRAARRDLRRDKPQSLAVRDDGRDYWRIFLSVPKLRPGERDQQVLIAILDWNAGRSRILASLICDPDRSHAVERFVRILEARCL